MNINPPRPAVKTDILGIAWMLSPSAETFSVAALQMLGERIPDDYLDAAILLVEDLIVEGGTFEEVDGALLAKAVHNLLTVI